MPKKSSFPPQAIAKTIAVLGQRLPHAIRSLVYRDEDRQRDMRPEKEESLRLVLKSLAEHYDGASGQSCKFETATTAKPLSVYHIVIESGRAERTVQYALKFLRDNGLLTTERQVRKSAPDENGMRLAVSDCYRSLTAKFWAMLGLLGEIRALATFKANQCIRYGHNITEIFISGSLKGLQRTYTEPPPPPKTPPENTAAREQKYNAVREAIARANAARLANMA